MVAMGFWALFFIPETKGMYLHLVLRDSANHFQGLTLEDMDKLFMTSTAKTVWESLVKRRKLQDLLDERRTAEVQLREKKEAVEQVERV